MHLYLSPHLDDAVLSCGGLIHRQVLAGEPVLVLTVFAGDPPPGPRSDFATLLGHLWQAPDEPMAVRRAEDEAALARLGASWLHWGYPDAIYRSAPNGELCYPDRDAIFAEVHPAERTALVDELAARLAALCRERRPAVVYSLLTAGHHVDHQLLQWAARTLEREWAVWHYEDYPYVEDPACLQAALAAAGGGWQAELEPLSEEDLAARLDAVACYRSQLGVLFGGEEAMRARLAAYARSLMPGSPAERYWRPAAGCRSARGREILCRPARGNPGMAAGFIATAGVVQWPAAPGANPIPPGGGTVGGSPTVALWSHPSATAPRRVSPARLSCSAEGGR